MQDNGPGEFRLGRVIRRTAKYGSRLVAKWRAIRPRRTAPIAGDFGIGLR
jgi:hypothetical protein